MYEFLYYDVDYAWILILIVLDYDNFSYFTTASTVYSLWTAYTIYELSGLDIFIMSYQILVSHINKIGT